MNSIGNLAYIATVASTLVGIAILVGGTLFLVRMTSTFKASCPPPVAHRREVDVYAVVYRAVLAREAEAKGPRPPPLAAATRSLAESLPGFAKVPRRLELAPPSSSRPRPVPENICA